MEEADKRISRLQWQRQKLSQLNQKRALSRSNSVITDSSEDNDSQKDHLLEDISVQLNEYDGIAQGSPVQQSEEQQQVLPEALVGNLPQDTDLLATPAEHQAEPAPQETTQSSIDSQQNLEPHVLQEEPSSENPSLCVSSPEPSLPLPHPENPNKQPSNNATHPALELLEVMESIDIHSKIVPTQDEECTPKEAFLDTLLFGTHPTEPQHNVTVPLTVVMDTCIAKPVQLQCELLNRTLLHLLMHDMKCYDHFVALRRYLLMHGGDFADNFGTILFTKVRLVLVA